MSSAAKERVLVVDDSPQNRLVATGHLEAAGFEVVAVGSGEEALDVLGKDRIDLVVLDVLMPGLGGFETCRRIRATPAMADVPVLFLTALGDREATTPAIEAGGDDLLPKPFHRAELLLRARALIRQRRTTAELKQALRALAEQNEALRRLEHDKRKISQLIVHDLKSPVGAVLANAELLRQDATGEAAEMIADIVTAAQQLDRTARDLLDLSRAEEGQLTPKLESFLLAEVADEVVTTMRGMARWTNVRFDVDVGRERVVADRELTRRMLQNLLHNAVKHAPANSAVKIEGRVDTDGLVLRVIDGGPGVPVEDVERIFDRFVTLDEDPARSGSHGLGLAFCRLAAEAHGGRIWVEDREREGVGAGACFCVRIPQPAS
ncbi:MAG TPA: hybrid sensor histidine kinase/response regulator [Kofleriaceae bacterium]|nr:hybrid sensor histidine kinase/response regulator [Kofleriaceae bacterium]